VKIFFVALIASIAGGFAGYSYQESVLGKNVEEMILLGEASDLKLYLRVASLLRDGDVDRAEKYIGGLAVISADILKYRVASGGEIPQIASGADLPQLLKEYDEAEHLLRTP